MTNEELVAVLKEMDGHLEVTHEDGTPVKGARVVQQGQRLMVKLS